MNAHGLAYNLTKSEKKKENQDCKFTSWNITKIWYRKYFADDFSKKGSGRNIILVPDPCVARDYYYYFFKGGLIVIIIL